MTTSNSKIEVVSRAHQQFYVLFRFCLFVLLRILSLIGTPLIFLLWIPSKIYKSFVIALVKVFCSEMRPISNPKCVILADDDIYQNPSNCSIVAVATIDGNLTVPQVTRLFNENVVNACLQEEPKMLRYPELQEYPVSFLGYPFLKRDSHFDPSDHISEYHHERNDFSETEIHQIMLNRPFPKYKSHWQLVIFRNEKQTKSLLALRIHHFMCDGRSVVKLFVECLGNQKLSVIDAKFENKDWKEQTKYFILLPFQLVRVSAYLLELQVKFFGHPWQQPHTFPRNKSPLFVSISPKIDLAAVKNAARVSGVQTSSVIISAVMGAIEQFFETKKKEYKFTPKDIPIYLALPKECHPPTFSNHLYIGIPEVPVIFQESSTRRLEVCDNIFKTMRQSDHAHHLDFLTGILATFPNPIRTHLTTLHGVPTGISNIAGEQNGFSVGGYPCLDFNLSAGMPQGSIGICFTLVSYKNHFQLSVITNGSILSKNDTLFMGKLVENQFKNLC